MGFFARSLASLALALVTLEAAPAAAQTPTAAPAAPPPPGGGTLPVAPVPPAPGGAAAPAAPAAAPGSQPAAQGDKPAGSAAGYAYSDKPVAKARVVRRAPAGPTATLPGFEQLPDGGSRLFVQLSQSVPVEERRTAGSITYVLKGAHVRVWNNTNALVTVHFSTPVSRARLVQQGNDVLFIVELRAQAAPTFKVADAQDRSATLYVDFPKGDYSGASTSLAPAQAPAGAAPKAAPRRAPPKPSAPPAP